MRALLAPLLPLQRFFLPALIVAVMWAIWRVVVKRDFAVGLALYIGVVVVVDSFLNTGIYLPGLEKGSIRYSEVCALVLLLSRPPRQEARSPRPLVTFLVWSYFMLLFVSVLRTTPLLPSVMEFRSIIVPQMVAFVLAKRGLDSPDAYRRFLLSLTSLVVLVGLFDVWDVYFDRWILKSVVLDKPIYAHNREASRFGSLFLNPNYLGAFVALVFPPFFARALNERGLPRLWLGGALLLLLFCLVETLSRAGLLAFGVCLLLLVIGPCGAVSRRRRIGFLAVAVVLFALVMPGFLEHASQRFTDDEMQQETSEGRSRETTWQYTERMILAHPVLGIGFGEDEFTQMMIDLGFVEEFGVQPLDAPHNSYLQAAVYAGIPALMVFLLANGVLIVAALRRSLRSESDDAAAVFGMCVGVIGFLCSIFPDLQLFTGSVAPLYWIFFALLLAQVAAPLTVEAPAAVAAIPALPLRPARLQPKVAGR